MAAPIMISVSCSSLVSMGYRYSSRHSCTNIRAHPCHLSVVLSAVALAKEEALAK